MMRDVVLSTSLKSSSRGEFLSQLSFRASKFTQDKLRREIFSSVCS